MHDTADYLKTHVFCRCGQSVSQLVESGLIERPPLATSEIEIKEWWLVSAINAGAGQPGAAAGGGHR